MPEGVEIKPKLSRGDKKAKEAPDLPEQKKPAGRSKRQPTVKAEEVCYHKALCSDDLKTRLVANHQLSDGSSALTDLSEADKPVRKARKTASARTKSTPVTTSKVRQVS
jgi:hypothetical protein